VCAANQGGTAEAHGLRPLWDKAWALVFVGTANGGGAERTEEVPVGFGSKLPKQQEHGWQELAPRFASGSRSCPTGRRYG
jgi:hypothetical protein